MRGATVEVSADRDFAVYADGEHLTDLPATLRMLPRALRVIAPPRARLTWPAAMSALFEAKRGLARGIGALSRRSGRGGGTTLPGRVLLRMAPDAIERLAAQPRARLDRRQRDQRQDDDGRA